MSGEFVERVSRALLLALAPVAAGGGLLAGWPGAIGGLAGGLVSLGSFRWIVSSVRRAAAAGPRGGLSLSLLGVGLRQLALFGAVAAVLWSEMAHPVALLAGLSVLPPLLVALGLLDARVAR
ncbi:MAG TPA: ATP synthase subunit I [Methylomirabilota bacterium]|jgi:hypothetical protein|nr:ATP synthase subunit I [Methylomirabilota bacterium]